MRDLLNEGLIFFEAGRYFEAHEAWEELWKETPPGPVRLLYQGLIQGAVGLHHFSHGNLTGARLQLTKALAKLEVVLPADDSTPGIDAIIQELRNALESMGV